MAFGSLKGTLGGNGGSITASNALTGSVSVSVGDLVFVCFGQQTNLTATGATDNLGNTYTAQNAGTDAGAATGRCFYSRVTVAGTLTQVNVAATASTNDWAGLAAVIEGPVIVSPIDRNPANITSDVTSPFTCPATGTLAQALEIVIAWGAANQSTTWSATSPNLLAGNRNNSTNIKVAVGYQAVNSTSSVSPAFTAGANPTSCVLGTASFRGLVQQTDGSINAQSATASGAGTSSSSSTSGSLSAQAATVSGAGAAEWTGTGALIAGSSTADGTGTVEDAPITGTGALTAQAADATGAGLSASLSTAASLAAQSAAASGAGASASSGTGALEAQSATVSGTGEAQHVASGALDAQSASTSGAGVSASSGTGALAAQAADTSGAGLSSSLGTGSLAAQAASVTGAGASASVGSGALVAQAAALDGDGTVLDDTISGTGVLNAQAAALTGVGIVGAVEGVGALAAQAATLSGVGTVAGHEVVGHYATDTDLRRPQLRVIEGAGELVAARARIRGRGTTDWTSRNLEALLLLAA